MSDKDHDHKLHSQDHEPHTGTAGAGQEENDNGRAGILFGNYKRTYDEYQGVSLDLQRSLNDDIVTRAKEASQYDSARQNIANQALQNAVETANMVGKQAVRHGDIAIDNQWNPVQQGAGDALTTKAVQLDDASMKAIAATVAVAVAEALKSK